MCFHSFLLYKQGSLWYCSKEALFSCVESGALEHRGSSKLCQGRELREVGVGSPGSELRTTVIKTIDDGKFILAVKGSPRGGALTEMNVNHSPGTFFF